MTCSMQQVTEENKELDIGTTTTKNNLMGIYYTHESGFIYMSLILP